MSRELTDLIGEFDGLRWRSKDEGSQFCIGFLVDGTCVKGNAEEGELIPGVIYQFFGKWEQSPKYGKQFAFQQFIKREPHSRHGLVEYLARYAPNIGPRRAGILWDNFRGDAVKVLRTQPEVAAELLGIALDKAHEAARALQKLVKLEETKIQLTNLFAGRGFPGDLVDASIRKWGILAPARIQRDPFCLLVEDLPGCGFARCDRLYADLGLPLGRLKRQMLVLWHAVREDTTGDTWLRESVVLGMLDRAVSGCVLKPQKAVALALRARWLARRVDAAGTAWIADYDRAKNEQFVASRIKELEASELLHEQHASCGAGAGASANVGTPYEDLEV